MIKLHDLFEANQAVTLDMICKELGCSEKAARAKITSLRKSVPIQSNGRGSRSWSLVNLAPKFTFTNKWDETVTAQVGEYIGFKCDIEQSAKITKIEASRALGGGYDITVVAPQDGFSGCYIGRCDSHILHSSDCY